ncbi:unnamed protein product [Schistosoma mattheei]|uniref:Uncharacterized protein n=1 Tax=Schistosoma mattheei TaxID=31246 RepID=A0A183NV95_9TREM|nr:unnamed protein product [Schistosoma mattheei]
MAMHIYPLLGTPYSPPPHGGGVAYEVERMKTKYSALELRWWVNGLKSGSLGKPPVSVRAPGRDPSPPTNSLICVPRIKIGFPSYQCLCV